MLPIDFLLTPFYLFIASFVVILLRKRLTDKTIRKYYLPAFAVKVVGAISIGLIYHFYYGYGDTLRYHWYATFISEKMWSDPVTGLRMLFVDLNNIPPDLWVEFRNVKFITDKGTFLIVRITAFLSFFCYQSYYAVAVLYATLSFSGAWLLFKAFYKLYPSLHKPLALATLFVPSIFFWGSGILKDSITLSALGWLFYAFVTFKEKKVRNTIIIIFSCWLIISIKLYILLMFVVALLIWYAAEFHHKLRHPMLRVLVIPILLFVVSVALFFSIRELGEINTRFAIENVSDSAEKLAKTQLQLSEDMKGSAYSLGSDPLDYSLKGAITKLPAALNVTLFRPYIWEVKNPVMVMAALESLIILVFTLKVFRRRGLIGFFKFGKHTLVVFCLVYAFTFGAAVGMTSYNFGTLVRYKIPCIPFYLAALIIINKIGAAEKLKKKKKLELQVK